jgi:hypothetical protein
VGLAASTASVPTASTYHPLNSATLVLLAAALAILLLAVSLGEVPKRRHPKFTP